MSDIESVIKFVSESVRKEEEWKSLKDKEARDKADEKKPKTSYNQFKITRSFLSLVEPCNLQAVKHRDSEKQYTVELEAAEKKLREEGVTVDVTDPSTGFSYAGTGGTLISGAMNISNCGMIPKFGAKVDQALLAAVEKAKTRMLEHRQKAQEFEKLARVFACATEDQMTELNIGEIDFFRLKG